MANLKKIAESISVLDDNISACMKCGTCQSTCPVFGETMREADVTRGKLALLANLGRKKASNAKEIREKLERCLLCGSCEAACPSGVRIVEIFMRAREISADYLGLHPVKKIVFRAMLSHPKFFDVLVKIAQPFFSIFMSSQKNAPNTVCVPFSSPFIGDRRLPQMPSKMLSQELGSVDISPSGNAEKVLFFPGCMGDKVYTDVSKACIKIFKHNGIGLVIPKNMACCGIPALASGDTSSFKKMLSHNLEIFSGVKFDRIITACASCTETIAKLWQKYADENQREALIDISQKTMDINEYLVDVLGIKNLETKRNQVRDKTKTRGKITYHDSCHLKKSLGISAQPRELIKANANYDFVEMNESDKCCGCGGSFTLTHYELSKKIGERKRANIISSGADTVACGCPACMMQISNMLALNGDEIKVRHTAEIYADTLE